MEKNNIEVSSDYISLAFKSLLIAVVVIYLFNHTGKFYTLYNDVIPNSRALLSTSTVTHTTTVTLSYKSPFGTNYVYPTNFKYEDTWTNNKGMNSYAVKAECYFNALLKDFVYVIILTVLIWSIGYFFTKNKLSIT